MDFDLRATARRAMAENGFIPDFPLEVQREVEALAETVPAGVRDLRSLLWSSIDNRESRDLDQIELAERLPYDHIRLFVAISDVDEKVDKDSATDGHAVATADVAWVPRAGEAKSIVVHDHGTASGGIAGAKLACLGLPF